MNPVLSVQEVRARYGATEALRGVTFEVAGGAVGLLGPNGAGKSTLIKALLGLVPLAGGRFQLLGRDSRELGPALRDRVGYVPEREGLRPGMSGVAWVALLGELSGLPRPAAVERAHEVLQYVGLEESRYRNVETFSTGMRQRLKLAAALVHDPALLLLDEPTSGMDPLGREEMFELCRDLVKQGKTILLSTHILKDVEALCAQVVILHQGRVQAGASLEDWTRSEAQHFLVQWEAATEGAAGATAGAGKGDAFAAACARAGWTVELRKDGLFKLVLPAGEGTRSVFRLARAAGGALNRLVREETSLEELFLSALAADGETHARL